MLTFLAYLRRIPSCITLWLLWLLFRDSILRLLRIHWIGDNIPSTSQHAASCLVTCATPVYRLLIFGILPGHVFGQNYPLIPVPFPDPVPPLFSKGNDSILGRPIAFLVYFELCFSRFPYINASIVVAAPRLPLPSNYHHIPVISNSLHDVPSWSVSYSPY